MNNKIGWLLDAQKLMKILHVDTNRFCSVAWHKDCKEENRLERWFYKSSSTFTLTKEDSMSEQGTQKAKHPLRQVFTIIERDGKSFWTRVGAAFMNRDGSETVLLDALPVNGRMQIRVVEPGRQKTIVKEDQA
jgi:hypothetical protein